MRTVELLSPAGDLERLKMAVAYGADAVYLAGKEFGMRAGAANFSDDDLANAVAQRMHKALMARVDVSVCDPGVLPRTFGKSKRVTDNRNL